MAEMDRQLGIAVARSAWHVQSVALINDSNSNDALHSNPDAFELLSLHWPIHQSLVPRSSNRSIPP